MLRRFLGRGLMVVGLIVLGTGVAYADQAITVKMSEFKFEPSAWNVKAGEKITFTLENTGRFPHDVHVEGQGVTVEAVAGTGNVAAGQTGTWVYTFEKPGKYDIWCPVGQHRAQGMVGTLEVTGAAALPKTGDLGSIQGLAMGIGSSLIGLGWLIRRRGARTE